MSKLIRHALHLNSLRKLVGWATLQDAIRNRLQLEILNAPATGKILVLAPHPDDDVFGVGGTLALHRTQGDEVRILYLCDGRLGTKRRTTELVQDELKSTRRAEAMAATGRLQISPGNITFWGYRDGNLAANKTTTKALTQILVEYVPSVIYTPHPVDGHPDHEATATILAQTLRAIGSDLPTEIWSYEVWQPLLANRLIDISPVITKKEQAIAAHVSQLKCRSYADAILGLNAYRGGMHGLSGPAEAFLALKPKMYLQLWELLRGIVG